MIVVSLGLNYQFCKSWFYKLIENYKPKLLNRTYPYNSKSLEFLTRIRVNINNYIEPKKKKENWINKAEEREIKS